MFIEKFNFGFAENQKIIQKLSKIDSYKGKWAALNLKNEGKLSELRKIATVESIGSSTRIEGATLTDAEVENLINDITVKQFTSREEQEVYGYFEALEVVITHWAELELSESTIKQLHNILLKHSTKDQRHKGRYKQHANQVVANYPDGGQRIIFRTTEPHLTAKEMQEAIAWHNEQKETDAMHPLLLTGWFIYEFLSIHPFQDGNGRLSRLLTTLLLLRSDYDFVQYISFEHIIEQRKQDYYRALMSGQQHRGTQEEKIGTWLLFFLDCMLTLSQKLDIKYQELLIQSALLNHRQKGILSYIRDQQPIQISALKAYFVDISEGTLKKDVLLLHREGYLKRLGRGRGTRYLVVE